MLKRLSLTVTTALILMGECVYVPEIIHGKLEVFATDLTGARLNDVEIELFPATGQRPEVAAKSSSTSVRYGDYRLRVHAQGYRSIWRDVRVHEPWTVVQVELPLGTVGCPLPPKAIGGRIKGDLRSGDLWVKAVPVRGTGGGESRVSASGQFLIPGLEHSSYVVMVLRGEAILHQQVIRTYPNKADASQLTIELP